MHSMKVRGECCKRRQVTVITLEMQDVSRLLSRYGALRRGSLRFAEAQVIKIKEKARGAGFWLDVGGGGGNGSAHPEPRPSALTRCGASRSVVQNRSRRFCEPSRCCAARWFASTRRHK